MALMKMAGPMPQKLTNTAPILGPSARDTVNCNEFKRTASTSCDAGHERRHEGLPRGHLKSAGDAADEDQPDDAPRGQAVAQIEQPQCERRGRLHELRDGEDQATRQAVGENARHGRQHHHRQRARERDDAQPGRRDVRSCRRSARRPQPAASTCPSWTRPPRRRTQQNCGCAIRIRALASRWLLQMPSHGGPPRGQQYPAFRSLALLSGAQLPAVHHVQVRRLSARLVSQARDQGQAATRRRLPNGPAAIARRSARSRDLR